ncbi:MAG: hypothetical protein P8099_12920 [Gemmatimonadota bacterium]|jgi:hypothetical protein
MDIRVRRGLILVGLLAGCSTATTPAVTAWQATLAPVLPHDPLNGNVAVVSEHDRLNASIQVDNAPAGMVLTWQLRTGACDESGDILGGRAVYPELSADSVGSATVETVVDRSLHSGGQYHASVFNTSDTLLACGELQQQ